MITGLWIDIETDYDPQRQPDPKSAEFEIRLIQIYNSRTKSFDVFGFNEQGYKHDKSHPEIGHLNPTYHTCVDEDELLIKFLALFKEANPDWISAWNGTKFDNPTIYFRMAKCLGESTANQLSPFNIVNSRDFKDDYGNMVTSVEIVGVSNLDYMEVYDKHNFIPRERMSLDFICEAELGAGKVDYSEYGNLNDLYFKNFQLYVEYGIRDVDLLAKLDEKRQFMNITYAIAYFAKANFEDTLGTVALWETIIYTYLDNQNRYTTIKGDVGSKERYPGAYVLPVQQGRYKWVLSIDLASLYPHLIQHFNTGPETLVEFWDLPEDVQQWVRDNRPIGSDPKYLDSDVAASLGVPEEYEFLQCINAFLNKDVDTSILKKHNLCVSGNWQFFSNERMSFLSELMRKLYADRKAHKKLMLAAEQAKVRAKEELEHRGTHSEFAGWADQQVKEEYHKQAAIEVAEDGNQQSRKILMNSVYGGLGNAAFQHTDPRIAAAITLGGQITNKWTGNRINKLLNTIMKNDVEKNYTPAGDTDSLYITLDDIVKKLGIENESEDVIADKLDAFYKKVLEPKIESWMDEMADYMNAYEQRMFWDREVIAPVSINVSKKRYAMKVKDSEGVRFETCKTKVIGLEAKKSNTPVWARPILEKAYQQALDSDVESQMHTFIDEARKKFNDLPVYDICSPTGVKGIDKYTDKKTGEAIKGAQKHIRSAINFNKVIKDFYIDASPIQSGAKIRYVDLKIPNPYNVDVLGFDGEIPPQMLPVIEQYADREALWQSGFVKRLKNFIDAIGWETEPKGGDLSDFFV